jgi:hypothetical protein
MPVADDPMWKEWLTAEKTLAEARDQLTAGRSENGELPLQGRG